MHSPDVHHGSLLVRAGILADAEIIMPYVTAQPVDTQPSSPRTLYIGGIFGNHRSLDVAGLTIAAAEATRAPATTILWPGSGAPLPENKSLVSDMVKHGTTAVAPAVYETVRSTEIFGAPDSLRMIGFSLGGARALALAAETDQVLRELILIDTPALAKSDPLAIIGYLKHIKLQNQNGITIPYIDSTFATSAEVTNELNDWFHRNLPSQSKRATIANKLLDATNLARGPFAVGETHARRYGSFALTCNTHARVQMHFVGNTFALDEKSVEYMNNHSLRIPGIHFGVTQGEIGQWHDEARTANAIKWALGYQPALNGDTAHLRHMYQSAL